MTMVGRQRPYLSYLLRLWMVEDDGPAWRASLENPSTAERHGFATLDQLAAFLVAETNDIAAEEGWNREADRPAKGRARESDPEGAEINAVADAGACIAEGDARG